MPGRPPRSSRKAGSQAPSSRARKAGSRSRAGVTIDCTATPAASRSAARRGITVFVPTPRLRGGGRGALWPQQLSDGDEDGSRKCEAVRHRRSSPGFLLQRAYHVPAADILLAAAGAVDDWSAEREIRVVDRFGTPDGDCLQPLGVEIGPGRLTIPVERVKEANMRRDERRSADDVAQPLAEFAQLRAVFDLDVDGPERRNDRARDRALRHS